MIDLADSLRGAWNLARHRQRRRQLTRDVYRDGGELRYHEQGQLWLNDHQGPATRTLRYRPELTSHCSVWLADGRFFHDLQVDTSTWEVQHPYRADLYYGCFEAPERTSGCSTGG